MMKIVSKIITIYLALFTFIACTEDENLDFLDSIPAPSNVKASYIVSQDNSGNVTITPTADNAASFTIELGDGTSDPVALAQGDNVTHTYAEGTYSVKITAKNIKGQTAEATQELVVSFKAPENLVVTIENDATTSKKVNVKATADFATMYEFHSGEEGAEAVTGNIGDTVSFVYKEPGTYTVKIIAKGAAIATTEYTQEFEVTEIVEPTDAAPTPKTRNASDVVSIFSDKYTNITVNEWNPGWGQTTTLETVSIAENPTLKYGVLNYTGIVTDYSNPTDLSAMTYVHFDYWSHDATSLAFKIVNTSKPDGSPEKEDEIAVDGIVNGSWKSVDIPLSEFTTDMSAVTQFLFVSSSATVYIDNLYFYRETAASFDDGLLNNGDFESGSDSWIVGVDDTAAAPVVTNNGNSYYSVNVETAGEAWQVNTSQKVEIVQGKTYTLTFDAWSDVNRPIIAGIGLSADPWSSSTETVNITTTRTTYTLTLSSAEFGAANARVLFDLGASVGMVHIDNVSLFIGSGNLVSNGNFEDGSSSWIVGVDDSAAAPVVTMNGNSYYSVNVETAGEAWQVNLSQKLEITQGSTYTLVFDAWSNTNRSIIAGIGLSADPWSSSTETVNITTTKATYTLTLSSAGFGAANARVLFDLGASAGTVNIDNVRLTKDN